MTRCLPLVSTCSRALRHRAKPTALKLMPAYHPTQRRLVHDSVRASSASKPKPLQIASHATQDSLRAVMARIGSPSPRVPHPFETSTRESQRVYDRSPNNGILRPKNDVAVQNASYAAPDARLAMIARLEDQVSKAPLEHRSSNFHPASAEVPREDAEEAPLEQLTQAHPAPFLDERVPLIPDSEDLSEPTDEHGSALLSAFDKAILEGSLPNAWIAFRAVLTTHPLGARLLPHAALHKLAALLSKSRPRTRENYLRLLSVISELRRAGVVVRRWQWNALIDYAGKGFRKVRVEDYHEGLNTAREMKMYSESLTTDPAKVSSRHSFDTVTLNTILSIAVRTLDSNVLRHATTMMQSFPAMRPDSITYLCLVRFYARTDQAGLVPGLIERMVSEGLPIGIDVLNGVMWAYSSGGQLDMAMRIYQVLRKNHAERSGIAIKSHAPQVDSTQRHPILSMKSLTIQPDVTPDKVTFTLLIQAHAFHGDLFGALSLFRDMLTCPPDKGSTTQPFEPTLEIYRSIFLGFSRHAVAPLATSFTPSPFTSLSLSARLSLRPPVQHKSHASEDQPSPWTHDTLRPLFLSFLDLPMQEPPKERLLYWIMVSFAKTTGNDIEGMRWAWRRLEERFGKEGLKVGGGRLARMVARLEEGDGSDNPSMYSGPPE
ncbi:hypothetical protein BOTBODRAFT_32414 [Botryobasidium botryosum FD-172 SS1]|uniref:Pentacotripeptide-repeat region of PRORP domain-containing protein n=1 Tax=Botryobasidium botryosum (strain FD-172 SS1) TaxID=930990 RepID=A0A067MSU6_BOTB1|nr:hypothetical protein BOTBODRAFT_32414 [Botryobasidium botryosum FD-172 SS1]